MTDIKPQLKALKIKTGVVKRYTKEKQSYEKEVKEQMDKIEKFKTEGKDQHFIRQQENCLKESQMMVPDIQRRLQVAFGELKNMTSVDDEEFISTEEYKCALQVLEDASAHLPSAV